MRSLPLLVLAGVLLAGAAWADDTSLRRCRAVADAAGRLACYDALPLPAVPGGPTPAGRSAPPKSADAQFGLPPKAMAEEPESIQSHIPGLFEGWRPNERIRLANGQVWQVTDESSSPIQRRDPKIVVRRGALGAFYLDIEGDNRSPRVRRVQ